MTKKIRRIFLDTSTIFAAVFSETGGARKLFLLGELGILQLVIGKNVLRECDGVIRRKVPDSLPKLAILLELGHVEISNAPVDSLIKKAKKLVAYQPDAYVLAEAMGAETSWFITHDKNHFLKTNLEAKLAFRIGTPGDFLQALAEELS